MAFTTKNAGDVAGHNDVNQFIWALTGLLPDQTLTVGQNLVVQGQNLNCVQITAPTISSSALTGTGGGTAATYQIASRTTAGGSVPGPSFAVASANMPAAPSGTNYITLTFAPVTGASSYDVIKNGSLLTTVTPVSGSTVNLTVKDTGQVVTAYTPWSRNYGGLVTTQGYNTPGVLAIGSAMIGSPITPANAAVLIQAGTSVVATSSVGGFNVNLPSSFPNGLITALLSSGDNPTAAYVTQILLSNCAVNNINGVATYATTGAGVPSTNIRLNWIALGW